ncbi:MAG: MBL fold metallo-hydrolase, partial [Candidatus ainarchaeum sp.]|nr:MBL fold metallo-hydrolase [Candidatus ainarchaeum sp.]
MKIIQLNVFGFDNNYSYLIVGKNNETIIIDPTGEKDLIEKEIQKNNLKIRLLLITHSHPDHIELVEYFKSRGIPLKNFEELKNNPLFEIFGIKIKTIFVPGHTKDSVCFLIKNNLFTGDTLFVNGIGTTSFGGNKKQLKNSIKLLSKLD